CARPPRAAGDSSAVRRQLGRTDRVGPHVLFRKLRTAGTEPILFDYDRSCRRRHNQFEAERRWIPRAVDLCGYLSQSGAHRNVLAKVDHQFNSRDQFTVRYSFYDVHSRNSRGAGGLNAATASADLDNIDQTVAVANVVALSPRLINETRAQF